MSLSGDHSDPAANGGAKLPSTNPTPDLASLLSQLRIEEKAALTAGLNFWETVPVPRLGIPSVKVSDGPNGARGNAFHGGKTSACFPASVSLAATWDVAMADKIGTALGQETKTKGAGLLLAPTVCPHRHVLGGRNFESFSEDPLLAGLLATHYINGLQREGIGATIKHYAGNEQETFRFKINAVISQRALREIYLKPFEIAIKRSKPWLVMTSYNSVNGLHSDMNKFLLEDILRNQWHWKGLVISDWTGTNSLVESFEAGLDLEMPGPPVQRKPQMIIDAVKSGKLSTETLNKRVEAVLELLVKAGKFRDPEILPEQAIDLPEHSSLIRKAGAEGIVLLKNNNNILPLKKGVMKSIAMLGLAQTCLAHGGGSASVEAHHKLTPWDAFKVALDGKVEMKYAEGAQVMRGLPFMSSDVYSDAGKPGFTARIYKSTDKSDDPVVSDLANARYDTAMDTVKCATTVITGSFKPSVTGSHYLSFSTYGNTAVYIDDKVIFQAVGQAADPVAYLMDCAVEEQKQFQFHAGQEYKIRIESSAVVDESGGNPHFDRVSGFRLGFVLQQKFEANLVDIAVEAAKSSDVALIFTGHTPEWETEGADRDTMDLPARGSQDLLISAVAAVNPNTIVINSTGSPISMPWLSSVAAVVQAWFPGQEAGGSIADVLLGTVNPCGKLPVTFPKSLSDTPAHGNFPGNLETYTVNYAEGIYIGYRHYDRKPDGILFPFGFGLSYTTFQLASFAISETHLAHNSRALIVSLSVTNTGPLPGREVIQTYISAPNDKSHAIDKPEKQLSGFAKTALLQPGQTETVQISIDDEFAAYWADDKGKWVVLPGTYSVLIGTSSQNISGTVHFEVQEEYEFDP